MLNSPSVLIIIVNWNNFPDTRKCLESLKSITYENFHVVVVDNGSTDESNDMIRDNFPGISLFELETNLGFAAGNNLGLLHAINNHYPYVLMLNNDTEIIQEDFLQEMVSELQSQDRIAAVGPLVTQSNGSPQRTILPYPSLGYMIWNTLGFYKPDLGKRRFVDGVSGCCVLVKTAAITQVGLLDENYFMYAEETEWFYRIRKMGWRVLYIPKKSILHKGASSSKRIENKTIYVERRANVIYTLVKARQYIQAGLTALFMLLLLSGRVLLSSLGVIRNDNLYSPSMLQELLTAFQKKWALAVENN
jgi:GT2 family glycosyltransferase